MTEEKTKVTAKNVIKALARRHKDDMFFTGVKNGATHQRDLFIIDALAIKISWTNYGITGYEVKVSRSDFLRDEKWRAYLPMCNALYWAVAPGVCDVSEIPDNCGLLTLTSTGGLRMLRKAPWRVIDDPVQMYKYLMFTYLGNFWDMDDARPRYERLLPECRVEAFSDYLSNKAEFRDIGRRVGRKLREEMRSLQMKADQLDLLDETDNTAYKEITRVCKELGVEPFGCDRDVACIKAVKQLKESGGVSLAVVDNVNKIGELSRKLLAEFNGKGCDET